MAKAIYYTGVGFTAGLLLTVWAVVTAGSVSGLPVYLKQDVASSTPMTLDGATPVEQIMYEQGERKIYELQKLNKNTERLYGFIRSKM